MSKRRMPQWTVGIVLKFLNTGTSIAELHRKYDTSPTTFQNWKDKFMEGGKQAWEIRQELIWKHTPEQNERMESFYGTLKREHVWPHEFAKFQDTEVVLARAFADYDDRIHSALGYVAPNEFARKTEDEHK